MPINMNPVNVKVREIMHSLPMAHGRLWTERNKFANRSRITACYSKKHEVSPGAEFIYDKLQKEFPNHKITCDGFRVTFYL